MYGIPALDPNNNAPNNAVHGWAIIKRPATITAQQPYTAYFSVPQGVCRINIRHAIGGGGAATGPAPPYGGMGQVRFNTLIDVVPGEVIPISLGTGAAYPTTAAGMTSVGNRLTVAGGGNDGAGELFGLYSPLAGANPGGPLADSGSGGAGTVGYGGQVMLEW